MLTREMFSEFFALEVQIDSFSSAGEILWSSCYLPGIQFHSNKSSELKQGT